MISIRQPPDKRPIRVSIICAATVCGRIAPGPVGSLLDRRHLEETRMKTDASLIGAETLRCGDPEMRGTDGCIPKYRIRAVITQSGNIPVEGKRLFVYGPPPVIFTGRENASALKVQLGSKARVIGLSQGPCGLSVRAALSELSEMGAESILVEGGAKLNYAAFKEEVVDEIILTLAPKILGQGGAPTVAEGLFPLGNPFVDLKLCEFKKAATGEIFLRYTVGGR